MKLPALTIPLPLLVLVLALGLPGATPTAVADGDGDMTTLLVKLPKAHVQALVTWTHDKGGRVVDTETMSRLVPLGMPQPDPKPVITRTNLPRLASGLGVLDAMLGAAKEAGGTDPANAILIDSVYVSGRHAQVKIRSAKIEALDAFRIALRNNTAIAARLDEGEQGVLVGSSQRLKDGSWRVEVALRFSTPYGGVQPLHKQTSEIRDTVVHAAATASGMSAVYASAVRDDAIRREGISLRWRDYKFQWTTIASLRAFLANVEKHGLVPTELRFKRMIESRQEGSASPRIDQPRIRLATVNALTR